MKMSSVKWRRFKVRIMMFPRISLPLSRVYQYIYQPVPDLSVLYSIHRCLNTWIHSLSQTDRLHESSRGGIRDKTRAAHARSRMRRE